ncbi:HAD domain-containing protein [Niveibacterium sp. SC-1]|uniref:HAD domain-containing protein n=1 Tax=Niveibacterium sp. SC-1 TaxID=3135646 RepID=UPI00311DFD13
MILFLDFDGVLHSMQSLELFTESHRLGPVLARFRELEIVISSSWREDYSLEQMLGYLPPEVADRVIGVTPVWIARSEPPWPIREAECREWLRRAEFDPDDWVALDDRGDLFSATAPLIKCDPTLGLDEAAVGRLVETLVRLEARRA